MTHSQPLSSKASPRRPGDPIEKIIVDKKDEVFESEDESQVEHLPDLVCRT
jgi:hypothetical protein